MALGRPTLEGTFSKIIVTENGDEEPPPFANVTVPKNVMIDDALQNACEPVKIEDEDNEETTIMERMMKEAEVARKQKQRKAALSRQKATKTFGKGLRTGFLSSSTNEKSNPAGRRSEISPAVEKPESTIEEIPTIRRKSDQGSFRFPEVQEKLRNAQAMDPNQWMTPAFMEKLSRQPHLLQALQNPTFCEAMELLQKDPKAAMAKYGNDAAVQKMLLDYMEFMGSHFEELGKEEKQKIPQDVPNQVPKRKSKEKILREAIASMPREKGEEAQLQKILDDPELQQILSDPAMRNVLQICQQPAGLQRVSQDPETARKLRKLLDAGLVQLQS